MDEKILFPHQKEAIDCLNKHYKNCEQSYSGLVVIPTGGGKTFTAVTWINEKFNDTNTKIIWFAQSFELLNQANFSFEAINPTIQKKVISSNNMHCKVSDISTNDSLLIITTQTAMTSLKQEKNKFIDFIEGNKSKRFIIILDEAHHAPALGCRKMIFDLFERLDIVWMLGLTATPTYTNRTKRGWLWEIFYDGIIYSVEKELLQQQRILAKENIIKKKTPHKVELSEKDFSRLNHQHTDIPENIIEELASNKERNDFIINEYLVKRDFYGKTIIFLDRWYQCIYFKEKLNENNINAEAIYYQNEINETNNSSNKAIIDRFRSGNIDVLLNIKMMTEGADVPDVKTVFITRDTTSHILLQQMLGRALRGERAGGKKDIANIVLFGDNWSKTIAWAKPDLNGGIEESRIYQASAPLERVSADLIKNVVKNMTFQSVEIPKYLDMIPIGWYQTEYVSYGYGEEERIEIVKDFVLVYESNKDMWSNSLNNIEKLSDDFWATENIDEKEAEIRAKSIYEKYFVENNISNIYKDVISGIIKICRHIVQNKVLPTYYEFIDRGNCNIEDVANSVIDMNAISQYNYLMNEYTRAGSIWPYLYENFFFFKSAVDMYVNRILFNIGGEKAAGLKNEELYTQQVDKAKEKEMIKAVKFRDNNCCLCCGLTSKETKLVVTDILNYNFGGARSINNLQTLCSRCNSINDKYRINYKSNKSILVKPKKFKGIEFDKNCFKNISRIKAAIKASINLFYECSAVFDVKLSRRRTSKNYNIWEVLLYNDNNIDWINLQIEELKLYIINELNQVHVDTIVLKKIY